MQPPDGLGSVLGSRSGLPAHNRAFGKSVGLYGVHSNLLQTRSWSPSRGTSVYDVGASILALLVWRHRPCARYGQLDVGSGERIHHPVPVLDNHPYRSQNLCSHKRRPEQSSNVDRAGRGCCGRIGLYLHRHLLVLGCRGRGLCNVVDVYGGGCVGYAQMGGGCR